MDAMEQAVAMIVLTGPVILADWGLEGAFGVLGWLRARGFSRVSGGGAGRRFRDRV